MIGVTKHKYFSIVVLIYIIMSAAVSAQDVSTEIAIYGFAADIEGESQLGNVEADLDVPFSDIIENLDVGAMLYIEHRRGNWSLIADGIYMDISVDNTIAENPFLNVELDANVKQLVLEGFIAYRLFESTNEKSNFGIDAAVGLRHIDLEVEVGVEASLLGLTASPSRDRDENWTDVVLATRFQYTNNNGWGAMGWADIGDGSDSSSYQLVGMVNYKFDNDIKLFGGYRLFHTEYEDGDGASFFEIDADYSGPQIGISKTF